MSLPLSKAGSINRFLNRARFQESGLSEVEGCRLGRGRMQALAPEGRTFRAERHLRNQLLPGTGLQES